MSLKILPVILAGGVGMRLWPLSRELYPKQFLRLLSERSLLQETVLRVADLPSLTPPLIVCNIEHYAICQEHLREINVNDCAFVLEPFGRNTAPAIACVAEYVLAENDHDVALLILPSDHHIDNANRKLLLSAIERALTVVERGFLTTFGIVPAEPETGYGYIQRGEQIIEDGYLIHRFVEKPPLELARQFVDSGDFYWNSGMFMFKPQVYLEELKRTSPDMYAAVQASVSRGERKPGYLRLNSEAFMACPNNSIDYAVMEKTSKGIVISLDSSWNDLGCWSAIAKSASLDGSNNLIRGEVLVKDSENCLITTEGPMVAALGIKDQIIVATPDAVLISSKARSQEVKDIVLQLKAHRDDLVANHKKQHYGASGYGENLAAEDSFSVEHFMLKPFSQLSLPKCSYETGWIMLNGAVEVIVDHQHHRLEMKQYLVVDAKSICQLLNKTDKPANLLRVQLKLLNPSPQTVSDLS